MDLMAKPGKLPADWRELTPMAIESYDDAQVNALYKGDLAGCFGPRFSQLQTEAPILLAWWQAEAG